MGGGYSILYLGVREGNSRNRASALGRLGHSVLHLDPFDYLPRGRLFKRVVWKVVYTFGGGPFEGKVLKGLARELRGKRWDLVWVNGGEFFGVRALRALRGYGGVIVAYNNDDPFGPRDRNRFKLFREAVTEYDLLVLLRDVNVREALEMGARDVFRAYHTADEVAHARLPFDEEDMRKWSSDVIFVGHWMPERGPFFRRLVELGVPVVIRGDGWQKAREWKVIRKIWAGPGVYGPDYVRAIQYAKVCLGLLSRGNRDTWTGRSAEIPFIGSVLCAERTETHMKMYREGEEAVFWSTPEECAEKCLWLLRNEEIRLRIAAAGRARCIENGLTNEKMLGRVLDHLAQRGLLK